MSAEKAKETSESPFLRPGSPVAKTLSTGSPSRPKSGKYSDGSDSDYKPRRNLESPGKKSIDQTPKPMSPLKKLVSSSSDSSSSSSSSSSPDSTPRNPAPEAKKASPVKSSSKKSLNSSDSDVTPRNEPEKRPTPIRKQSSSSSSDSDNVKKSTLRPETAKEGKKTPVKLETPKQSVSKMNTPDKKDRFGSSTSSTSSSSDDEKTKSYNKFSNKASNQNIDDLFD